MNYYRTYTEIAELFNVSKTTITRWIDGAEEGRNNLQVDKRDKKVYVLKNEHNYAEMLKLKEEGSKYRPSSSYAEIEPKSEFYEIFSKEQQIEIINSLKVQKKIDLKFTYMGEGAKMWDEFYVKSLESGTYPVIKATKELLDSTVCFLNTRIANYKKINIIDLGPGNSYPIQEILNQFVKDNKLGKYIAVDISKDMLQISEQNIKKWFGNSVEYKSYIRDLEHQTLMDILFENKTADTLNIVFALGGTIGNFENHIRVYNNIRYSLDNEDIFVNISMIDKNNRKTDFDRLANKNLTHFLTPKLLSVDIGNCDFYGKYNDQDSSRIGYFLPDKDYKIKFKVAGVIKEVELSRDESIAIWYHKMLSKQRLFEDFEYCKMELIFSLASSNLSHMLTVCQAANN